MIRKINFEDIRPFVRYAKILRFPADYDAKDVRAYDNRLLYFFEGKAILTVGEAVYPAERGNLFVWTPDTAYSLKADGGEFSALVVNFDYTFSATEASLAIPRVEMRRFDDARRIERVEFLNVEEFNEPIVIEDARSLEMDLIALDKEFVSPQRKYIMVLSSMMTTLMVKVYRRLIEDRSSMTTSLLVTRVIEYIQNNYRNDISNTSIGAEFNYHPNYINRSMLNSTGQSLHQYVINVRILHALELIQTTDLSITEISKMVGFKSIKHFSQSFKKTYGFSPTHFKSKS